MPNDYQIPITIKEITALGWPCADIILVSGDAYVDHPSFAAAMVANRNFYAVHWNATLMCSLNMPVVSPYVAAGLDSTYLEAQTTEDTAMFL